MLQGKIVFCAPTKPLLNQQVTACYNKMSVSKVQPRHNALLIAEYPHFRPVAYTLASDIAFWQKTWQYYCGCRVDSSVPCPIAIHCDP